MKRFLLGMFCGLTMLTALPVQAQTMDPSGPPPSDPTALAPTSATAPATNSGDTTAPTAIPTTTDVVKNEYFVGTVRQILEDKTLDVGGYLQPYQKVVVEITNGSDRGKTFDNEYQLPLSHTDNEKLHVGDQVVVVRATSPQDVEYYVAEPYRFPQILWVFAGFLLVAVIFGRWRGLTSAIGLAFSLFIIIEFLLPRLVAGANPIWTALLAATIILFCSLYLAHGFNKRTTVALAGTVLTLLLAAGLSTLLVWFTKIFGTGSEDSLSLLQGAATQNLDLHGLYLGGILIGAIGVLDDITTAQSATVDELHRANPSLSVSELYKRGLSVGREHIASLVNTLALAYVGASLPILLIFTQTDYPAWFIVNSEFLAEEIVRTIAGSITLILAVPLTTYLAAVIFGREKNPPPPSPDGGHGHHHH